MIQSLLIAPLDLSGELPWPFGLCLCCHGKVLTTLLPSSHTTLQKPQLCMMSPEKSQLFPLVTAIVFVGGSFLPSHLFYCRMWPLHDISFCHHLVLWWWNLDNISDVSVTAFVISTVVNFREWMKLVIFTGKLKINLCLHLWMHLI